MYMWVVEGFSWPSQRAMTVISTPDCSRCKAVACRIECGDKVRVVGGDDLAPREQLRVKAVALRWILSCRFPGGWERGNRDRQKRLSAASRIEARSRRSPERNAALLLSFSMNVNCGRPFKDQVLGGKAKRFRDACASVVEGGEESPVALTAPSAGIRGIENGLDLCAREKFRQRVVESFHGHSQGMLNTVQRREIVMSRVLQERAHRR